MIIRFLLLSALLFLSGCDIDLFNEKKVDTLREKNLKLQNELYKKEQQLQLELAKEKKERDYVLEKEKIKTQAEIQKVKIQTEQEKELAIIQQKTELEKEKQKNEIIKYGFGLIALLMLIIAYFIYFYFKRKRENKLKAYEDNLKKYFLLKENEMKLKLAEKILDTAKEGQLSKEDQKKLISLVTSQTQEVPTIEDATFIEHKEEDR
jgi:cbb3-type cytochrome oxidase subunit 3